MIREIRQALVVFALLTVVTGVLYPGLVTLVARVAFPGEADGSAVDAGRAHRRLGVARPVVQRSPVFLGQALGDRATAQQRRRLFGLEPRGDQPRPDRSRRGSRQDVARGGSRQSTPGTGRSRDGIRQAASIRIFRRPRPTTRSRAWRACAAFRRTKSARWWRNSPKAEPSEYWASPGSMSCVSISRSMLGDERLTIS